jgi:hypothetical protein
MQQVIEIQRCFHQLLLDGMTVFCKNTAALPRSRSASASSASEAKRCLKEVLQPAERNAQNDFTTAHTAPRYRLSKPVLGAIGLRGVLQKLREQLRKVAGSKLPKFIAEALNAPSADLVSEITANVGGQCAARIMLNKKTEQHRCTAV